MGALGHQAATALREPVTGLRLVTDDRKPQTTPQPGPQLGLGEPAAVQRLETAQLAAARDRIRELENEVAHLRRKMDAEREAGRRDERAVVARTMGGRLPSILGMGRSGTDRTG